jgi:hypothetical protein
LKDETRNRIPLRLLWTVVFTLNLIVPLILGWSACDVSGRIGMGLAILSYWGLGVLVCSRQERWGRTLVAGAIPMAFLQLLPLAQIVAGILAFRIWTSLGETELPGSLSGLGGFVVTWITGGFLIALALLIGMFLVAVFGEPSQGKPFSEMREEL